MLKNLLHPSSEMSTLAPGFFRVLSYFFSVISIKTFQQLTIIHQNWKYYIIAVLKCTLSLSLSAIKSTFYVFDPKALTEKLTPYPSLD